MITIMPPGTDIFETGAEALVVPVNCVGVAGAGLALAFKQRYPEWYRSYHGCCADHLLTPGRLYLYDHHPSMLEDKLFTIVNFPTKYHWKDRSRLEYIQWGLDNLACILVLEPPERFVHLAVTSIAIPALGCGLGGLDWDDVLPEIQSRLGNFDTHVMVIPPRP